MNLVEEHLQVVAVDWIFFDIYLGVFLGPYDNFAYFFSLSYFWISENLKNRTGLDFERGQ